MVWEYRQHVMAYCVVINNVKINKITRGVMFIIDGMGISSTCNGLFVIEIVRINNIKYSEWYSRYT